MMATPRTWAEIQAFGRALRDAKPGQVVFYNEENWFLKTLSAVQDEVGHATVNYHRGRYFYITPSHFFHAHHEPSPSDCTWMVPKLDLWFEPYEDINAQS